MKEIILAYGGITQVSDEDHLEYYPHNWLINKWGYIYRSTYIKGKNIVIYLHIEILKRKLNSVDLNFNFVDHLDMNKFNNTRENLRAATKSQNMHNGKLRINNKSGHRGVSWDNKSKKWSAQVYINNYKIHIGYYDSKEQAIADFKLMAKFYYGEFARFDDES